MLQAINWFEIPSTDFNRAVSFYSTILGTQLRTGEFLGVPHGFFSAETGESEGAIIKSDAMPGERGPLLYLNAAGGVGPVLSRVEAAGGKVLVPETSIGEQGSIAVILDTEGNRIGLHSARSNMN